MIGRRHLCEWRSDVDGITRVGSRVEYWIGPIGGSVLVWESHG